MRLFRRRIQYSRSTFLQQRRRRGRPCLAERLEPRLALAGNVAGTVYDDVDADTVIDAGEGLANWTVYADLNNSGSRDGTEPQTTSSSSGFYSLSGLPAGAVVLRLVAPTGWQAIDASRTVTVVDNTTQQNQNFRGGLADGALITGAIWHDADGNGTRDTGETLSASFTVYADLDNDSVQDSGEPVTTTSTLNSSVTQTYRLFVPQAGTYMVRARILSPWQQVSPVGGAGQAVTVAAGQRAAVTDFVVRNPIVTVSGSVFEDVNSNSTRDSNLNEIALGGWRVYADLNGNGAADSNEPSATTSSSGLYTLTIDTQGSMLSSLAVRTVLPAGWVPTGGGNGRVVTSPKGGSSYLANFGNQTTGGVVGGIVWSDANGDGMRTEPVLSGRTVYADLDDDGVLDAEEPQTTSLSDGTYQLLIMTAGVAKVRQIVPFGWEQTSPAAGTAQAIDVALGTTGTTATRGSRIGGRDFGVRSTSFTFSGTVFNDLDSNGVQATTSEASLSGWRVFADRNDNGVCDTDEPSAVTSASGAYSVTVTSLTATTTVKLRLEMQAGWQATSPNPALRAFTVSPGGTATNQMFGVKLMGPSIGGTVWNDADGDGLRGPLEVGLSGWMVFIDTNNNGAADSSEVRAYTSSDGSYVLQVTAAGDYKVRLLRQGNWLSTNPVDGLRTVTVGSTRVPDINFGTLPTLGYVTGTVYDDANDNGAADLGEMGLLNWRVFADFNDNGLVDGGEPQTMTTTTGTYSLAVPTTTGSLATKVRALASATSWSVATPAGGAQAVTVVGGQTIAGRNFGGRLAGSLVSGRIWEDTNGNGVFDSSESGQSGVTVFADANGNGIRDSAEAYAVTTSSGTSGGIYQLPISTAGAYTIRLVSDASWLTTAPAGGVRAVTLGASDRLTAQDFGRRRTIGYVSGTVFNDADGGGTLGTGEAGLGVWRVFADLNGNGLLDNAEPATFTATNGTYSFSVTLPGATLTTTVRADIQPGWKATQPASATQTVTVAVGTTVSGRNFGFQADAAVGVVSGITFNDTNGNGIRDTNDGTIAGRTVYVDNDGDGVMDADEPRATTGSDGVYRIAFASAGSYTLRQVLPYGYLQSAPVSNAAIVAAVAPGDRLDGRNFGSRYSIGGIAGTVFQDPNANGVQESGEVGLSGWRVYVDSNGNGTWDSSEPSALTASNGSYSIGGVLASQPTVALRTVVPAGWAATMPVGGEQSVAVVPGSTVSGRNFGNRTTVPVISGLVWNDINADGMRSTGEATLSGRPIFVDADSDGVMDADELRVYSAQDGTYRLMLPAAGTYAIRQLLPQDWAQTAPAIGAQTIVITTADGISAGNDFGSRYVMGRVEGYVFSDANSSGTFDTGEGTAGVVVYADLDDDDTQDANEPSFMTSSSGWYSLTVSTYDPTAPNAASRTVSVRTRLPSGWGPVNPSSGERAVSVTVGPSVTGQNFTVNLTGGIIAGLVWNDMDGDGVKAVTEGGLGGWTVYADANGNGALDTGESRTATAGDGTYRLLVPVAGDYTLRQVAPGGWIRTTPSSGGHAVTVAGGESFAARNFGNRAAFGTVSGLIYDDADGNGSRGTTEAGLGGWQVYADLDDDGVIDAGEPSTGTSSSGSWSLQVSTADSPTRTVKLRAITQAGWAAQVPADAAIVGASVTGGRTTAGQNFGFRLTGTVVSGTAWNDLLGNGTRETVDGPLPSRTVYADLDGDSTLDANEPRSTTASDGRYQLMLTAPGDYTIRQVLPANWVQTAPIAAYVVTVGTDGARLQGRDFGSRSTVATVAGTVFEDLDVDGVQDAGEVGVGGVRVYADMNDDGALTTGEPSFLTSSSGSYVLTVTGLTAPTAVKIRQAAFAGWTGTLPADGTRTVELDGGKTVSGVAFGNRLTGAIVSGTVWDDLNANGVRDTGERGVGGRTVYADANGNGTLDNDELRTTTLPDGTYQLVMTSGGSAAIRTVLPGGWQQTLPASGSRVVDVTLGNRFIGNDFGTRATVGGISGFVFHDLDASGTFGSPEVRLGGWVVFVDGNNNGVLDDGEVRTTTTATGTYILNGITEGLVNIRLQLQVGWEFTSPADGLLPTTVVAGKTTTGRNFGVRTPPPTV